MGVFNVKIKLKNWKNGFLPKEKRGESVEYEALVNSGATKLVFPVEYNLVV